MEYDRRKGSVLTKEKRGNRKEKREKRKQEIGKRIEEIENRNGQQ